MSWPSWPRCARTWLTHVPGELRFGQIVRLRSDLAVRAQGHEQRGPRFGVVVQNSAISLSTILIAPTSTRAHQYSFRPQIQIQGVPTLVLVDQTSSCDLTRISEPLDSLTAEDQREISGALRVVFALH